MKYISFIITALLALFSTINLSAKSPQNLDILATVKTEENRRIFITTDIYTIEGEYVTSLKSNTYTSEEDKTVSIKQTLSIPEFGKYQITNKLYTSVPVKEANPQQRIRVEEPLCYQESFTFEITCENPVYNWELDIEKRNVEFANKSAVILSKIGEFVQENKIEHFIYLNGPVRDISFSIKGKGKIQDYIYSDNGYISGVIISTTPSFRSFTLKAKAKGLKGGKIRIKK